VDKLSKFLVLFLFVFSFQRAHSFTNILDGDFWPYPWGVECPFPWDTISNNMWSFMLNDKKTYLTFYSTELENGKMNLLAVASNKKSQLVAFSNHQYNSYQNILVLRLKDLTEPTDKYFTVLIRIYDDRLRLNSSSALYGTDKQIGYCQDEQRTELAITVATGESCSYSSSCSKKAYDHQIAERVIMR